MIYADSRTHRSKYYYIGYIHRLNPWKSENRIEIYIWIWIKVIHPVSSQIIIDLGARVKIFKIEFSIIHEAHCILYKNPLKIIIINSKRREKHHRNLYENFSFSTCRGCACHIHSWYSVLHVKFSIEVKRWMNENFKVQSVCENLHTGKFVAAAQTVQTKTLLFMFYLSLLFLDV